jgi:hypothetical protein
MGRAEMIIRLVVIALLFFFVFYAFLTGGRSGLDPR